MKCFCGKNRIVIVDQVLWFITIRCCITDLLFNPNGIWVAGNGTMFNLSGAVIDDHEDIQNFKCEGRGGEKIRSPGFAAVVSKK